MRKVGMIGGKYLPLTIGHVNSIIQAYTLCDELYIVLSHNENREKLLFKDSKMKPVPYKERHKWLYQVTRDLENVTIVDVEDTAINENDYDWNKGAEDIKKAIGKHIDIVFHSDMENRELFKSLYMYSEIITFDRSEIGISATRLRHENDIYKLWDYVPKEVKPYFIKKVCVIGSESCAKSTLVKLLAKRFNTNYVSEYGRDLCEYVGGAENMQVEDYYEIALKHKCIEMELTKLSNKVLFIDTDSLITQYYLKLYTDKDNNSGLFSSIHKINKYDLYLFLEPDVTWVQDGTRLHGEDLIRQENNNIIKKMFDEQGVDYIVIKGDYNERLHKAVNEVEKLLI